MTRVQLADVEWEFIRPYLPVGEYGPYPGRLRQQFEGVIWRFRTAGQWREMPQEFGAWSTVHNRFRQWRDAGVFEALLEGLIAEAAKRGEVDLSLVSVDSTTARAHHDAAGMHLDQDVLTALEKAAAEEGKARQKGAANCMSVITKAVLTLEATLKTLIVFEDEARFAMTLQRASIWGRRG